MYVTVNGETRDLADGTTIVQLLALLDVSQAGTAVEVNREIVSRSHHAERLLRDGDVVEIVTFVGGG